MILFVNHGIDPRCGVHNFGVRYFNAVKESKHDIRYVECNSLEQFLGIRDVLNPSAVIINYMPATMPWVNRSIRKPGMLSLSLHHLYDSANVSDVMNQYSSIFDHMIILDPAVKSSDPRIHALSRPIPPSPEVVRELGDPVRIGTFGFALPHKQIPLIAREVNRCFDSAVIHLHMTEAFFNGANGAPVHSPAIMAACKAEITKPGISIVHSDQFLADDEVVELLSKNDINALFYDLPPSNIGRSSSLDFMIAARRPILTTKSNSFEHAFGGLAFLGEKSFSDIIADYPHYLKQADDLYYGMESDLLTETDSLLEEIL